MMVLQDRVDAGERLAAVLRDTLTPTERQADNAIVLGLPRGGVPVAHAIAKGLQLPLSIYIVRKVGVPGHRELAMGAVASGGVRVLNRDVIENLRIPTAVVDEVTASELAEVSRREAHYGVTSGSLDLRGKTVIVADDGIATGATMRAAIAAIRQQAPARLILAVGVAPPETCAALTPLVDQLHCLIQPENFGSVGMWFGDFTQVSDETVTRLLGGGGEQKAVDRRQ